MQDKPLIKSRTLWVEGIKGCLTIVVGAGLAQVWFEPEWAATIVVGLRMAEHWASVWLRMVTTQPLRGL